MACFYNAWMEAEQNDAPESKAQIGARIVLTREALGLTQKEFALRCGISNTRLEGYESGRNLLKPEMAVRVIKAAGDARVDFNWLYHGDMGGLAHGVAEKIKAAIAASDRAA